MKKFVLVMKFREELIGNHPGIPKSTKKRFYQKLAKKRSAKNLRTPPVALVMTFAKWYGIPGC